MNVRVSFGVLLGLLELRFNLRENVILDLLLGHLRPHRLRDLERRCNFLRISQSFIKNFLRLLIDLFSHRLESLSNIRNHRCCPLGEIKTSPHQLRCANESHLGQDIRRECPRRTQQLFQVSLGSDLELRDKPLRILQHLRAIRHLLIGLDPIQLRFSLRFLRTLRCRFCCLLEPVTLILDLVESLLSRCPVGIIHGLEALGRPNPLFHGFEGEILVHPPLHHGTGAAPHGTCAL